MTKKLFLFFTLILGVKILIANPIAPKTAQQVAENFLTQNTSVKKVKLQLAYTETLSTGVAAYYVFNINSQNGFIIISADDAAHPIIGYSTKNQYVVPTKKSPFAIWMSKRKVEIGKIVERQLNANAEISGEWERYSTNNSSNLRLTNPNAVATTSVSALVQSTWDQSPFYNDSCPGGSVTGCVATTMAQIMRYWNYPAHGKGASSYCDCSPAFQNTYGTLSANYGTATYNWANMPLNISSSNSEIAKLMRHCGISVQMDYSPSESGAWVITSDDSICAQHSYVKYFKYNGNTIQGLFRTNYTDPAWISLLQNELNAGRPVQYVGWDPNQGGHTWVCDGYDQSNNFHMNWGWGGIYNGFFSINNLNPDVFDFSDTHEALIGIQPLSLFASDAGVQSIINPVGSYCNSSINPSISLENFGTGTLTSCTINYYLDNQAVKTQSWTGSLLSNQSTSVSLSSFTTTAGTHTLTCYTSNPNGVADSNTSNDQSVSVFTNGVKAAFTFSQPSLCSLPSTVQFTNNTLNGATYAWNFGDGAAINTSLSPSHTYTAAGTYQIKLVAQGLSTCPSSDSATSTIYIVGGPHAASCTPVVYGSTYYGILNFALNTINNSSNYSNEGYKDFTCTNSTILTAGNNYSVTVTTNPYYTENVKIWIDYNNDGALNASTELAFTSNAMIGTANGGIIFTPTNAILNTPLRLRVIDESSNYTISGPCYNPSYGQAEDYTVIFNANTAPPVCNFTASVTTVLQGGTVNFTDLSNNVPTAWNWTFSGGTASASSTQNPSVVYNTLGTYPVKLKVSNTFGSDSLTKTAYINVVTGLNMCSVNTTSLPTGTLFDSGGPSGNYNNNETCTLLIDPGCASSITLSFLSFNTESYYDELLVYDGTSTAGTLLLTAYGTYIPNSVTAPSGKMFIKWTSSSTNTFSGFQANWTSVMKTTQPPLAQFSASSLTPLFRTTVNFTDNTTQFPNIWKWTFGDGNSSTLQNPSNLYLTSGTKTVTLIATNCVSTDTVHKVITIQQAPAIQTSPDTLKASVNCSDSATMYLKIKNSGNGKLAASISGNYSDSVNVLVFTDSYNVTDYNNTILAMQQYFRKVKITLFSGTTPTALQAALTKQQVLLFPTQINYAYYFSTLATVVQNFANQGGIVIVNGDPYNTTKMYDMGLFTGSYMGEDYSGVTLNVLDTTNQITKNLPLSFTSSYYTYYHNITSANKIKLVSVNGYDVVSYCNKGAGKVIFMGFDYYTYGNEMSHLISNAVKYALPYGLSKWISLNRNVDTVGVSATDSVLVKFKSVGYSAGHYTSYITVQSNDTAHPFINIPCIMNVHGNAGYSANPSSCVNFGTIMQYTSKGDTVFITNTGCDTLKITSISSGLGVYTNSPSALTILPGYTKGVNIIFSPINTGTQSTTYTLTTNIGTKTICATGNASSAPIFNVNPKNISVNLSACGSSTTIAVAAQNSGQGVLLYSIPGSGNSISQDTVNALIMTYGIDMSVRYPNMVNAITQNYSNATLTQHLYSTPAALSAALQNKKVLIFPAQLSGTNYYAQMASVVQNFVSNGGIAIVCGSYDFTTNIYDLGLFTGTYQGYTYYGTVNVLDTTNRITKQLPLSINAQDYTIYNSITNSDKVKLAAYNNYDVVSYRNIGSGKAIFIGYDYYYDDINSQRLLSNSVKLAAGSIPQWISLSTSAGNVAPNTADTIRVTLSSTGLTGGTYNGNIIVQSNDPRNPYDTVACTLNVSYNPCPNFSHHTAGSCGSLVAFTDSSINLPNSWYWNFGDGTSSTQANPTHTYTATGIFTVKLKVCNSFGCDSISKNVTINPGNPPSAALCTPVATSPCCGVGIFNVKFNTINNATGASTEGYKDFTCTASTTVVSGGTYTISVTTGASYSESVEVWIDYNNNGLWDSNELVLSTSNQYTTHTATVIIPTTAILNTPLRMRVGDDEYNYTLTGCSNPYEGQYEDYTVIISPNSLPPTVNFSTLNTNSCNGSFSFTDLSTNNPTSWLWNFGDGGLSSLQNPTHTFANPGTYTITLVATNSFGSAAYYKTIVANSLAASINVTGSYVTGNSLSFSSSYTNALSYSWNFGDGSSSGLQSPAHTYSNTGTYVVALNLVTPSCTITKYDTLTIGVTGIASINFFNNFSIAPNPFSNTCTLKYTITENSTINLDVLNVIGQTIIPIKNNHNQSPGTYEVPITIEMAGIYFLRVEINGLYKLYKIIKQ